VSSRAEAALTKWPNPSGDQALSRRELPVDLLNWTRGGLITSVCRPTGPGGQTDDYPEIACVAWSSAPRHLGARDRYIGWSAEARRRNLRFLAYNSRFLVLPWVSVKHLASHILGQMARRIAGDWQQVYGHPVYFLETFVDPERHRGTCYRAANWVVLGRTTGRGKNDQTNRPNRSIKEVLGYPLTPQFRELLAGGIA
jgi:hypothetical protein